MTHLDKVWLASKCYRQHWGYVSHNCFCCSSYLKIIFVYSSLESADVWLLSSVRWKWLTVVLLCPFLFHCLNLTALRSQIVQNYITHGNMTNICLISLLFEQLIQECERRKKEVTLKFLGDGCYSHQITWIAFLSVSFFLHYFYIVSVSPQFIRCEYKRSANIFILWY